MSLTDLDEIMDRLREQMAADRANNPAAYWGAVSQAAAMMQALHEGEITREELIQWLEPRLQDQFDGLSEDDHPGAAQGR